MNKYVLVEGKPYLWADGRAYAVRRNKDGFKVGNAVELPEIPTRTYSEMSINAKFRDGFDSIGEDAVLTPDEADTFNAVPENVIGGTGDAEAEDIVIVRDGPDLIIPNEAALFTPDEMTVAELKEYAAEHGINLNGATVRDEIIGAIYDAQNVQDGSETEQGEGTIAAQNESEQDENTKAETEQGEVAIDYMTVAELRDYAAAHNINLTGVRAKADIVEAIKAATEK